MKPNRTLKASSKFSAKTVLAIIGLVILLSVASTSIYWTQTAQSAPSTLKVEIQPRNVKLGVGQIQTFYANVSGGVKPYNIIWQSNGSVIGEGISIDFSFETAVAYTILFVNVTDKVGNYDDDYTIIYDPFVPPNVYLDDLPSTASFKIATDGSYTWATKANGDIAYNNTNANSATVINNVISSVVGKAKIVLGEGTFPLLSSIDDNGKSNIEFCGLGQNVTIITFANSRPNLFHGIHLEGFGGSEIQNWYLHDFTIDGNWANQGNEGHIGIHLQYFNDSTLERVTIKNINGKAGDTSAGKGVDGQYCNRIFVSGCRFIGKTDETTYGRSGFIWSYSIGIIGEGLHTIGGSSGWVFYIGTNNSIVANSVFERMLAGGSVFYRNAHWNVISECTVIGRGDTVQGFYISHGDYEPCYHNIIIGCTITNCTTGINIALDGFYNQVIGNNIDCSDGGGSKRGINVMGSHNIISNNYIYKPKARGIGLEKASGFSCSFNIVSSNTVYDGGTMGFYVTGGANQNMVEGNIAYSCDRGIEIDGGQLNTFKDNELPNSVYGIYVPNGDNNVFEHNLIRGSYRYIKLSSGSDNNIFRLNDMTGYTAGRVEDGGANNLYKWNIGYVTENSGRTVVANGENVAHGLVAKPVYASVTCLNATYQNAPVIVSLNYAAFTTTNIQVNVYWSNGTAIIADAIHVMWEARTWN